MPIIKANSTIHEYEIRASHADINELTGRNGNARLSQFVIENICQHYIGFRGLLVDVGCGDALLYKMLHQDFGNNKFEYTGVLPSPKEVERVTSHLISSLYSSPTIVNGRSDSLPLADDCADGVVINGVLPILESPETAVISLKEIHRISKSKALVFIGEVPSTNELAKRNYGDSIPRWLLYVLTTQGVGHFLAKTSHVVRCLLTDEILIIKPKPKEMTWFAVQEFLRILENLGFEIVAHCRHREITNAGKVIESQTRWDYLVRVVK